ncbi:MAG: glycosyltransferase family 2 protein [Chloroherpetonaceae bacterium]|nr:glycosyltransferase family 2 protein [Chloroherpetonaceae bacterium]
MASEHQPDISYVIPLYNESESLPELIDQIKDALTKSNLATLFGRKPQIEILLINDGSSDGSDKVAKQLIQKNPEIKLISFRRNYGKSAALDAGFKEAKGRYVITMDADLQDSPYETEPLIRKVEEGFDLVSGWKQKRFDPLSKTIPSKLFNFVTSRLAGIPIHDFNCGLKIYRNDVVKSVHVYGEMHRYIPVLAKWNGFTVSELVVEHRARKYGSTKFGISRFFYGFLDLLTVLFITKYMKRPMHFFGVFGIICTFSGSALGLYLTIEKLFYDAYLSNRPMLFLSVLLIILGVQLFMGGLLGEMITKSYHRVESYLIKERINFEN